MKSVMILLLSVLIVVTGIVSYKLFENGHYLLSSVFIVASYLSISLNVYMMGKKQPVLS